MNEEAVGNAIKECGVSRDELFITTKLWVQDASYEAAKKAVETSMHKLGVEYLDLYLIHQPMGDYYGAYRALEELYKEGVLRAIGICNCYPHVLADLCETVEVIPAVNQVELHPFFQQEDALALMKEYDVQTALRWNVQRGVVVIPKSTHKERMEQNMDIWDFALSDEDMQEISALDMGHNEIVNHYDPAFVKKLHSRKIHE